jgi:hypothetical protein
MKNDTSAVNSNGANIELIKIDHCLNNKFYCGSNDNKKINKFIVVKMINKI